MEPKQIHAQKKTQELWRNIFTACRLCLRRRRLLKLPVFSASAETQEQNAKAVMWSLFSISQYRAVSHIMLMSFVCRPSAFQLLSSAQVQHSRHSCIYYTIFTSKTKDTLAQTYSAHLYAVQPQERLVQG